MEYPKTQTLWQRDENNNMLIIEGVYSKEEFRNILHWRLDEKIDGTNIRIYYSPEDVYFKGRKEKSQLNDQNDLLEWLKKNITWSRLYDIFGDADVVLYGEGIGPKVGTFGGKHFEENDFVLFDIKIGKWWLEKDKVIEIAQKLNMSYAPTIFDIASKEDAIMYIKTKPISKFIKEKYDKEVICEGIIARPLQTLLYRDGDPITFKLKVVDYEKLERFKQK